METHHCISKLNSLIANSNKTMLVMTVSLPHNGIKNNNYNNNHSYNNN